MGELLFVYGTLRRRSRHPMARRLAQQACWLGTATILGRLYDLGRYPGLLESSAPADIVHGDLYDVGSDPETLRAMDAYENEESPLPAFFERQRARVQLDDGTACTAWVYWFRGPVAEEQRIASGNYDKNFFDDSFSPGP